MSGKALVAGLIGGAALIAIAQASCDVSRRAAHSAHERQLAQQVSKWRARYAEAKTDGTATVETLRVVEHRVRVQRDTVLLHLNDTVAVKEYVYQTDTLRTYCQRCAARFDSLKARSDSLIWSYEHHVAFLAKEKRPRNKPCGVAIGAGYLLAQGQPLRAGLTVGAACRLWP